jgi:lipopolysaccharide/colanic/teichoic acid biosynthesis glycosyltransferase
VAITMLVALAPLMIVISAVIKLTSPGPVVFRQTRCGIGGRHFTCYKFRTMFKGAEALMDELADLNEVSGPVFKLRHDPRITWAGRFLRKSSLDEVPQLINVLRGDMSLVGPRPPVPEEVAMYTAHDLGRLAVKPGMTCLWQVSGRSNIGFAEWVELDLEYIRKRGFWYDAWIMMRTIPAVVSGRGAV